MSGADPLEFLDSYAKDVSSLNKLVTELKSLVESLGRHVGHSITVRVYAATLHLTAYALDCKACNEQLTVFTVPKRWERIEHLSDEEIDDTEGHEECRFGKG